MKKLCNTVLFMAIVLFALKGQALSDEELSGTLLYSKLSGDFWQIWLKPLSGDGHRRVTQLPYDCRYPVWNKKEKKIAFRNSNGRYLEMVARGGEAVPILSKLGNVSDLSWSRDGDKIAFARYRGDLRDDSDIWIADSDGGNARVLVSQPGLQINPCFSPDGKRIAYSSGEKFPIQEIWAVNLDGSGAKQLTRMGTMSILPRWAPDGSRITFVGNAAGNYDIWIMDQDGKGQRQLTTHTALDTDPGWSPDGRWICFTSSRGGKLSIWLMDSEGKNKRMLLTEKSECRDPVWVKE